VFVLVVAVMFAVAGGLAWSWWTGRSSRRPVASVHSFNRALEAMQPDELRRGA